MRILFYVEPVSFNNDLKFFSPVMNLIRCIINANQRSDVDYGIATTSSLIEEYDSWLRFGGRNPAYTAVLSEKTILEEFDFDRKAYANFLFDGEGNCDALSQHFAAISCDFDPHVIVSFTQNRLIEQMSGEIVTLFSERGPLPRWNGRDNFYFDPAGHQTRSVLATRGSEIVRFGVSNADALDAIDKFRARYDAMANGAGAGAIFRGWLDANRKGRRVAMIANQPHDSLLVQGAAGGIDLATHLMRTMAELPSDWMAFGTYHPIMGDCSKLDERLAAAFSNYVALPPELRQIGSDPLSAEVDALITVGSKAALPALLLGKKVVVKRGTMFAGLASTDVAGIGEARALTPLDAGRVLAFLASRYTIPSESLLECNGYWLAQVEQFRGSLDLDAFTNDASGWDSHCVDRMYGAAA